MKLKKNDQRRGVFYVSDDLLHDSPDLAAEVMAGMLIVEARFDYSRRAICYLAISPLFEPVSDACMAPTYSMELTREGTTIKVRPVKCSADNPVIMGLTVARAGANPLRFALLMILLLTTCVQFLSVSTTAEYLWTAFIMFMLVVALVSEVDASDRLSA